MIDWDTYKYPKRTPAEWALEVFKASLKERLELLSDPVALHSTAGWNREAVREGVVRDKVRLNLFTKAVTDEG